MTVRILDLYSGMGGLTLGFLLGLKDVSVIGLDIDKYAIETFNFNLNKFNAKGIVQDVLEWEPKGEYDMIVGGVPCQPYSIANTKKRGREHELYPTLPRFFDLVLNLEPKVFLMENVKGMISSRNRTFLESQIRRVENIYNVKYTVLNASHYGVPQRRERLFVLGIHRDLGITPSFPKQTHGEVERDTLNGHIYKWVTVREAIGDLLSIPVENYPKKLIQTNPKHGKPVDLDKPSRTVKVDGRGGDFTFDTILVPLDHVLTLKGGWTTSKSEWGSRVIPLDKPSYTITEKHRSGQLVEVPSESWLKKHPPVDPDKPSNAIASNTGKNKKWAHNSIIHNGKYRRLTVRECLRIQSFPDWWTFPDNVSISRRYKLVGEAVPPALSYRLAIHIGSLLNIGIKVPPKEEEWDLPFFKRMFRDLLD